MIVLGPVHIDDDVVALVPHHPCRVFLYLVHYQFLFLVFSPDSKSTVMSHPDSSWPESNLHQVMTHAPYHDQHATKNWATKLSKRYHSIDDGSLDTCVNCGLIVHLCILRDISFLHHL